MPQMLLRTYRRIIRCVINRKFPSYAICTLCSCIVVATNGSVFTAAFAKSPDDLAAGFENPPVSARPYTWWHWMNGCASKEGITADLESMKRIGLAGPTMFCVTMTMQSDDGKEIKGDLVYMSPEWQALVQHAIEECKRLGLEFSILTCEGYGQGGGTWVPPEEGMQKLVWSERRVEGGAQVRLDLPAPNGRELAHRDIALVAFPTPLGDENTAPPSITSSRGGDPIRLVDGKSLTLPVPMPGFTEWLQLEYDEPHKFSSINIAMNDLRDTGDPESWESSSFLSKAAQQKLRSQPGPHHWELQVSDDGKNFRPIGRICTHGTSAIPETSGRFFKIIMPVPPPLAMQLPFNGKEEMTITSMALSGPRLDRPEARVGAVITDSAREFSNSRAPSAIPNSAIVDLTGKREWNAPPGKWTLLRLGHVSQNSPVAASGNHGIECDKLSRQAVLNHLTNGSLNTVLKNAGPLAGTAFKNIVCDSMEAGYENWSPFLPQEFRKRRGYAIDPWLPALAGFVVGSAEESERFLWDFRRTLADLVVENYYGTLREFAHQHNLNVSAEAAGHGLPTIIDQLQAKGMTDTPLGEFWSGRGDTDDAKEAASAAHIYGKKMAGTESFTTTSGIIGRTREPYAMKAEGDLRFCLGINRFSFHTFAHQPWLDRTPGMTMSFAGPNLDRNATWWEMGGPWITYVSRCQYLLQQGRFVADVCYYYGEDAPVGYSSRQISLKTPPGYDFDVCNTEILHQMSVEDGRIILPSGMKYRVLVLPNSERMTPNTLRSVSNLVKAGATVVGPKPRLSPSLIDYPACDEVVRKLSDDVWGDCDGKKVRSHAYGAGSVRSGVPLTEILNVPPDFSSDNKNLRYIHRRDENSEIYFVSNQSDRDVLSECKFRVDGLAPEFWHPDTGAIETAAVYESNQGCTSLPLQLGPSGSVFVVFRQPASVAIASVAHDGTTILPPVATSSDGTLNLPSVENGKITMLVSKPGKYTFTNCNGSTRSTTVAQIPAPLPLHGPWQLQFSEKLGAPPSAAFPSLISWSDATDEGIKYFSGTAKYRSEFKIPPNWIRSDTHVFLNLGVVKNLARVTVNDEPLEILWKPPFRVEVTSTLHQGDNKLEIDVANLWPNRLIGDKRLSLDKRVTWVSYNPYEADSPLLPSGLLGPVTLEAAQQIKISP